METAQRYRRFALDEVAGTSACYEQWALAVADDTALVALIDELPAARRQPNLVLAAARFAGIEPVLDEHVARRMRERWPEIRDLALTRRTQTNESGRCAVLLPLLAQLPQPLALLEVGASAGLCLYPDRLSYQYGDTARIDPADGPGPLVRCAISGPVPVPTALPQVVWRAGIDLNPLDVTSDADVRWLDTLIWPGQDHRRARLAATVAVARADPPLIRQGDLATDLFDLIEQAPDAATLVVSHTAVLSYVDAADRATFVAAVTHSRARWISNEAPQVLDLSVPGARQPIPASEFVMALDGTPVAIAAPHGQSLYWLG